MDGLIQGFSSQSFVRLADSLIFLSTKAQCRGCIQTCRSFEGEAMHIALLVDRCASSLELQKVRRQDTRMKREKNLVLNLHVDPC